MPPLFLVGTNFCMWGSVVNIIWHANFTLYQFTGSGGGWKLPFSTGLTITITIRHRASTSTHWHFTFVLCCHSNETHAPIANPPNSAQLEGTPTIPPSYIRVHAAVWECSKRQTHTRMTNINFAMSTTHAKCNNISTSMLQWSLHNWPVWQCLQSSIHVAGVADVTQTRQPTRPLRVIGRTVRIRVVRRRRGRFMFRRVFCVHWCMMTAWHWSTVHSRPAHQWN